jgi:prephenate dehydrogenase
MWSELFLENRDVLLEQMDMFMAKFAELRAMISEDDADGMREMMRLSTQRRALFDKK